MALTKKMSKTLNGSKNKKNSKRMKTKKNRMKGGSQGKVLIGEQKPTISQQKLTVLPQNPPTVRTHKPLNRSYAIKLRSVVLKEGEHPFSAANSQKLSVLQQQKPVFNNTHSKDYFLSTGKILNTGNRSARININDIKIKLKETTNLSEQKKIISSTLSGKYEPEFVNYAIAHPEKFKELLRNATFQREVKGTYEDPNKFLIKKS